MNAGRRRQRALELLGEALRLLNRSLSSANAVEMRGYAEQARERVEEALLVLRSGGW